MALPGMRYGGDNPFPTWRDANFRSVQKLLASGQGISDALLGRRPELLERILGPRHQVWVGGSARVRHEIWLADAEGIPIWILCSRRGTSYEMQHPGTPWDGTIPPMDEQKFVTFLEYLFRRMQEVAPVSRDGSAVTPTANAPETSMRGS